MNEAIALLMFLGVLGTPNFYTQTCTMDSALAAPRLTITSSSALTAPTLTTSGDLFVATTITELCRIKNTGGFERGPELRALSCPQYAARVAEAAKGDQHRWACWILDPCGKSR